MNVTRTLSVVVFFSYKTKLDNTLPSQYYRHYYIVWLAASGDAGTNNPLVEIKPQGRSQDAENFKKYLQQMLSRDPNNPSK